MLWALEVGGLKGHYVRYHWYDCIGIEFGPGSPLSDRTLSGSVLSARR